MKLVESYAKHVPQGESVIDLLKHMEMVGRVTHRSEKSITEDSCIEFCNRMKALKHLSVLRHGTIYLTLDLKNQENGKFLLSMFTKANKKLSKYSHVEIYKDKAYVTTNFQAVHEAGLEDVIIDILKKNGNAPTEFHEKRMTFEVVTNIGASKEFNRHTTMAVMEQSTRYCNYSKGKFDNNVSFCIPMITTEEFNEVLKKISNMKEGGIMTDNMIIIDSCIRAEEMYMRMTVDRNMRTDVARGILPQWTATKCYYTGFMKDWRHFIELRASNGAHHDARVVAAQIKNILGL